MGSGSACASGSDFFGAGQNAGVARGALVIFQASSCAFEPRLIVARGLCLTIFAGLALCSVSSSSWSLGGCTALGKITLPPPFLNKVRQVRVIIAGRCPAPATYVQMAVSLHHD